MELLVDIVSQEQEFMRSCTCIETMSFSKMVAPVTHVMYCTYNYYIVALQVLSESVSRALTLVLGAKGRETSKFTLMFTLMFDRFFYLQL